MPDASTPCAAADPNDGVGCGGADIPSAPRREFRCPGCGAALRFDPIAMCRWCCWRATWRETGISGWLTLQTENACSGLD